MRVQCPWGGIFASSHLSRRLRGEVLVSRRWLDAAASFRCHAAQLSGARRVIHWDWTYPYNVFWVLGMNCDAVTRVPWVSTLIHKSWSNIWFGSHTDSMDSTIRIIDSTKLYTLLKSAYTKLQTNMHTCPSIGNWADEFLLQTCHTIIH